MTATNWCDYQGTRTSQGIDTGFIDVPTLAERTGNFSGIANQLTGTVSGPYIANLLTQTLRYGVTVNEPYYTPGCTSTAQSRPRRTSRSLSCTMKRECSQ
jgi:hypothetical protein